MKLKILLIGQCTLHLGRMEHGNIGNYYILEPLIKYLKKVFPNSIIKTTFQLTDKFCKSEEISCLPMSLYYSWSNNDLDIAKQELKLALDYKKTGRLKKTTLFMEEILKSDLIIDFSGDIWGSNADLIGKDRYLVGLIKDRIAQLLGKKIVMIAGSPGPFKNDKNIKFAKETYKNFDLVTNREPVSSMFLKKNGFDLTNTLNTACPSFLFNTTNKSIEKAKKLISGKRIAIGFILCGWNFTSGPFDKENRADDEYLQFIELIEYASSKYPVDIYLMSHSNGFKFISKKIILKHGRDYPIIKKVAEILKSRGKAKNIFTLDGIYDPLMTKSIISRFDMLISGRIHGAIAALSQYIPTVIIDYGHEPKAHKLQGFAMMLGVEKYLADPSKKNDLIIKFRECWKERKAIKNHLKNRVPEVRKLAKLNFDYLKKI